MAHEAQKYGLLDWNSQEFRYELEKVLGLDSIYYEEKQNPRNNLEVEITSFNNKKFQSNEVYCTQKEIIKRLCINHSSI